MANVEWGVFTAEGCTASGLTEIQARSEAVEQFGDDNTAHAAEICPDHEEQERYACEDCATDQND